MTVSADPVGAQVQSPRQPVPADAAGTGGVKVLVFLRDRGIVILWLVLVVVFAFWAAPHFFTWTNARLVANAAALSALFAAAVAFGIMSGALDLSVPAAAALAGVVAGKMITNGAPVWVSITVALSGAAIGFATADPMASQSARRDDRRSLRWAASPI
jgi:predicted ABC-type sugar transport system permease subunit